MLSVDRIVEALQAQVDGAVDQRDSPPNPPPPFWIPIATDSPRTIDLSRLEEVRPGEPSFELSQEIEFDLDNETFRDALGTSTEKVRDQDPETASVGFDFLAWYAPYHCYESWGIYIPKSSLLKLAHSCFRELKIKSAPATLEQKVRSAYVLLLLHERFHFISECMVSQWELILRSPCRQIEKRARDWPYLRKEEKLANAYMLREIGRRTKYGSPVQTLARNECAKGPPGYCDAPSAEASNAFETELCELTKHYTGISAINRQHLLSEAIVDMPALYPFSPEFAQSNCPVYVLDDLTTIGVHKDALKIITQIPKITETKRFRRKLKKLMPETQERWRTVKSELAVCVPRHPEFEKLRGGFAGLFSVRVTEKQGAVRAHLRPVEGGTWEAVDIAPHKKIGHG